MSKNNSLQRRAILLIIGFFVLFLAGVNILFARSFTGFKLSLGFGLGMILLEIILSVFPKFAGVKSKS